MKRRKCVLKPSIPVFIGYFTTWVDHTGKINFRPDIYGLDTKLEKEVFGTEKLIQ
jgi:murein L,D-transpeptidase YcbB/YkuD